MTSLKGADVELSPIPHLPLTPAKTDIPTRSAGAADVPDGGPSELERQATPDQDVLSQIAIDDVGPPPDGGLEAWLVVVGAGLCTFCIFGFSTSFGQLQVYYLDHQLSSNTPSEVGWISSITVFLVSMGSIFSGRYFDTHGARRLLIAGSTLQVGAFVAIAFSKNYWQLFLSHTCVGLAGSVIYAPATAVAGQWFLKRRSTAVALVAAGSGLGGICYPLMLKSLIESLEFRDALLVIAGFNAVCMLVANFTMKARLPPRAPPPWKALLKPWQDPRYTFYVVGTAVALINWASPYFNAPVLAKTNYAPPTIAGYAVVILQTGSFFGRVVCGPLADRFGVWKVFIGVGISSAISLLAFWAPYPMPGAPVVIGLFAYGAFSGAFMSLIGAACAAISPVEEVGTRIGILWTCSGLPCLAGPVVCGALVTVQNGRFGYAAIFCAMTILFGNLVTLSPVLMSRLAVAAMKKRDAKSQKSGRPRA